MPLIADHIWRRHVPPEKYAHKAPSGRLYAHISISNHKMAAVAEAKAELARLKDTRETALIELRAAEATLDTLVAKADAARGGVDEAKKRLDAYTQNMKTIERRMLELLAEHNWTL
jgi:DNA repair ATPase RecN